MARFQRGQVVIVGHSPGDRAVVTDPAVDNRGRIAVRSTLDGLHLLPMQEACRPLEDVRPGTNAWALMQLQEVGE